MNILCLTKDSGIYNNLVLLYGQNKIKTYANPSQLNEDILEKCDVLIVDLVSCDLPEKLDATLPLAVLSAIPMFHEALSLIRKGVRGYGNRKMRKENLKQLVETVYTGQIWLPPELLAKFIANAVEEKEQSDNSHLFTDLTGREKEVANCVASGMSNQEIADQLFVSLRTVKAHLSSIYDKTGLKNRLELGIQLKNNKLS